MSLTVESHDWTTKTGTVGYTEVIMWNIFTIKTNQLVQQSREFTEMSSCKVIWLHVWSGAVFLRISPLICVISLHEEQLQVQVSARELSKTATIHQYHFQKETKKKQKEAWFWFHQKWKLMLVSTYRRTSASGFSHGCWFGCSRVVYQACLCLCYPEFNLSLYIHPLSLYVGM